MSGDSPSTPSDHPAAPAVAQAPAPARPVASPQRRWARRALYAVGGLAALWGVGWLAVPPLLKWQGEKIASAQLGRAVHIGRVDFKPWTLELTLDDVSIDGLPGAPAQLAVKRAYVDAELQSVLRLAPVIDAIRIESPAVRLSHLGDGRYDIDDILARLAARPAAPDTGEPARFALYNISLDGGSIDFDDRVVGRQHQVRDVRLALPFISNLPSERQIKVQPRLAFVANGTAFDSQAQALPFDASRQTDAVLRLSGLDLAPYLGYVPAGLPIKLQGGKVDADVRLGFVQSQGRPSLRLAGTLALQGLKSVDGRGADALAWDALKIALGDVRPLERQVHLASVELVGPQLVVHRDKDGRINLLPVEVNADASNSGASSAGGKGAEATLKPASAPAPAASHPAAPAAAAAPWQVTVDKLALRGGTVDFTDDTTAQGDVPAARVRLNEVDLNAQTLGYPLAKPVHFSGSAALVGTEGLTPPIPETAPPRRAARAAPPAAPSRLAAASAAAASARESVPSIEFQGNLGSQAAELNARIAGVPLALAAPYLTPHLVPHLTGDLDAHVGLQWAPAPVRDLAPEFKLAVETLALRQLMLADAPAAAVPAKGAATPRRAEGPLASIDRIDVADVLLDWRTRAVTVGKLGVQAPRVAVERRADGRLSPQDWLRQDSAAPAPDKAADAKPRPRSGPRTDFPWKVVLNEFGLTGGTVGWRDAATPRPAQAELTQLQVHAQRIDLDSRTPMPVNLSARLGAGRTDPGRVAWRGTVGLQPALAAQGQLEAERLPVHAFEPYFGDALNIDILRADTSFKGQLAFTQTAQGPRARVTGDASVHDLRTHSRPGTAADENTQTAASAAASPTSAPSVRRAPDGTTVATAAAPARPLPASVRGASSQAPIAPDAAAARRPGGLGEELLSWKLLRLAGLDVQLEPGKPTQVDVKDTALSDFYARLIIHPSGRINLQDVVKSKGGDAPAAAAAPAPVARAAPSTMPAAGESSGEGASASIASNAVATAPSAQNVTPADPNAPVIRFGPVRLANGRVAFSDRFIRPNYSADLTELNGSLGAFSSVAPAGAPQMAELNLTGRAEGTAALAVTGKLNPLAKPLALDIQAKVTDLELPPLSPYSVKYAGHGIERGKLSMDVAYEVQPDGQLTASNRLVLNQLEFGEPVPGAPASLPVKLATALLADSRGVIDLDLPISGSLNDPQFSVGPIIVKAIVNLIGKAITAPFTLLARALGGSAGDDMSSIAFAPGSAQLQPKAREQLDKIAKALADRPQLKLTVVGSARLAAERDGYRRERLKAMVAAERRAGGAAAGPAGAASAPAASASDAAPATAVADAAPDAQATVSAAEYPQLLRRLYRRADLPGKPRNAVGVQRDIGVPEMESLLMAQIDVGEDAMRQLALARGVAVKDYLAARKLPAERLFLGAPRAGDAASAPADAASGAAPAAWSPRAELTLAAR
ncbi:DUF748 domain-containing protein [Ottowia sp.]|uniref:DUF748 domain-containing protein n=1 Tax=Ottowia sp. TaxID=1898956 RepID=UPI002D1FAE15|nr:DUF748 domain-containing protein [Ottowia sp.]